MLASLLAGAPSAWAGKKKPDASDSPGASPTPKFNVPIPVKHSATGVKLPYFDEKGRLQMFFTISMAFRTDIGHLTLTDAYVQTFDEKETPSANIIMSKGVLDLNTRIVTSDVPVTISRADFDIVGQRMVFNTQTRKGHMDGHVHMTIYNHQSADAEASPAPGASPTPSATPASGASPAVSPAPSPLAQ
jgi:hypothetical protein